MKIQNWHFIVIILIGAGVGAFVIDLRKHPFAAEILRGQWDHDWDAEWRPWGTLKDPNKNTPTHGIRKYVGLLEQMQSNLNRDVITSTPPPYRSTKQVILLRHGQYKNVGSDDDDEQGLTTLGQEQADLAGQRLAEILKDKKIRAIYHSDMKRAKETAHRISKFFPSIPLKEDPALAEGVPEFPEPPSATFCPTNLEVEVGRGRIDKAFRKYFFRPPCPSEPPSEDGEYDVYDVIVCHGNVIRYMFCRALQFPTSAWLRLATFNCGLTWLSIDNRGYVSAREFGNVGFLPSDKVTYY